MTIIDSQLVLAFAACLVAASKLIWSIRRKP